MFQKYKKRRQHILTLHGLQQNWLLSDIAYEEKLTKQKASLSYVPIYLPYNKD